MVFWNTYPIKNVILALFNTSIFKELIFDRENYEINKIHHNIYTSFDISYTLLSDIRLFLKLYFGNPPHTPIFDIPEEKIISQKDIIIVAYHNNEMIGCIRYHYIGIFYQKNIPIYSEDCFCIHPLWRKKGIGDYLLTKLHIYVNNNNMPYSMFLKEGSRLNIVHIPIYSGIYVYKKINKVDNTIDKSIENIAENNKTIISITNTQAFNIIKHFQEIYNNTLFTIIDIENEDNKWILYTHPINTKYKILACFKDTYQTIHSNKMAWCTGWFETPNIPLYIKEEAINNMIYRLYPLYTYIWMNKELVNNIEGWEIDGPFYWYTYQWTTNINIKNNYCITV
jgi:hypothetical protein